MLNQLTEIRDYLYKYLETRIELFRADTQEKIENAAVQLVYVMVLLCLCSACGIFILTLLASLLNEWLESRYAGFSIMLGLTLLLIIIWLWQGSNMKRLIRKIFFNILKS